MNKISLLLLLTLIYLGLSKWPLEEKRKIPYIAGETALSSLLQDAKKQHPASMIVEDVFKTGFLIKTYYIKIKIIRAFRHPQVITVMTSKSFWSAHRQHIGMSIFRRPGRGNARDEFNPLPPGLLFVGDPTYGTWERGGQYWQFHRSYRYLPVLFGRENLKITKDMYREILDHRKMGRAFYGKNNKFKSKNTLAQKVSSKWPFKKRFKKFLSVPQLGGDHE